MASNCNMTNNVTWTQMVKVVKPIYLEPNISKTLGDTDLVPMEQKQETKYGESKRHVIDDVTWLWKVKVVTRICLGPNISKTAGDRESFTMERL